MALVYDVTYGHQEEMNTQEIIDEIWWHEHRIVNSGEYDILFSRSNDKKNLYVWIYYDPEREDEGDARTEQVMAVCGLRNNSLSKILKEFGYTVKDLLEER
jgi:hypothetical protein